MNFSPKIQMQLTEKANEHLIKFMKDYKISKKSDAINQILERWM